MVAERGGAVCTLAFDSRRYVGAQIGIHNPQGEKVGTVSRLRNVEYVVVGGDPRPGRARGRPLRRLKEETRGDQWQRRPRNGCGIGAR